MTHDQALAFIASVTADDDDPLEQACREAGVNAFAPRPAVPLPTGNPRAQGLMECPEPICGHSVCFYEIHGEYRCDNPDCGWCSTKPPPSY